MIILDTNVISELMTANPNKNVATWFAEQNPADLFTTSINIAEVLDGLQRMPRGRRQRAMAQS
ncbi:PIN domain-containing protein, partial [Arthrospira platensis SPKY1]|nr:PIN domain-containing protein [Arthrospira platensis SPKY1]